MPFPRPLPVYTRNYKRLSDLDPYTLDPIYDQEELEEPVRFRIKMEFATTETEVHQADIGAGPAPLAQDIIASITNKVIAAAKLTGVFDDLYPVVKNYLKYRCFNREIDFEKRAYNSFSHLVTFEALAKFLKIVIPELRQSGANRTGVQK